MNDLLRQIVATTRASLNDRPRPAKAPGGQPGRFRKALRGSPTIIAEIKAASPSAGAIIENPNVEEIARSYARGGAAAISVVTEPRFFHGSAAWVARAKAAAGLPVLMKDFIVDPIQIHEAALAGADAILLIAAILAPDELRELSTVAQELGLDALVEVHDERELKTALDAGATIIGVNNRDLRDFSIDLATAERLGPLIPASAVGVAESGVRSRADVERLRRAGFHAFLVGESLLRQSDHERAVRALIGLRVKICGITSDEAARVAVDHGAAFIGLVFAPGSPRQLNIERARRIADAVRGSASVVGVFRDQPVAEVLRTAEEVQLDFIQLHGSEQPDFLDQMTRPLIKALPVNSSIPDTALYERADWLMFDARSPGAGQRFDWELLRSWDRRKKFFLAGGLNPQNVIDAIRRVEPDAIDVSSGVETSPGVKSPEKIRRLFEALRS